MSEQVKHTGVAVEYGDRTLYVPPLNTDDSKRRPTIWTPSTIG